MFKSYLKIALRSLQRRKLFSLVTLGGLTLGMSACMIILLYVSYELSYDDFHVHAKNIYRISMKEYREGEPIQERAKIYGFIGPAVSETYPEVKAAARLINLHGIMGNLVMRYKAAAFTEEKMYYADPAFLTMFSFPLIEGEPQSALSEPYTAVITESAAKKYFSDESPTGKSVIMNGKDPYLITGVLKDIPDNSHLKFDFLLSFATLKDETYMLGWADFLTYIWLAPGTNLEAFTAKLAASNLVSQTLGSADQQQAELSLQPLRDIHLHSHLAGEAEVNGSAVITYGLMLVAFLILLIAWMNYVNLSTARSLDRAKEVGIRKVVGARRSNLLRQFLLESLILNAGAAFLALLVISELLPFFTRLIGRPLSFSTYGRADLWGILLLFLVIGSILSSLYPAFVLSSFRPIKVLKSHFGGERGKFGLRKVLLVCQFAISVTLIAGTLAVLKQVSFMRNKELGIDVDRTVVVKAPGVTDSTFSSHFSSFKTELLRYSTIQSITSSSNVPGRESTWGGSLKLQGNPDAEGIDVDYLGIDYDFIEAYGLKLLAGRNFSLKFPSDQNAVILNEAAFKQLQLGHRPEEILDKQVIGFRQRNYHVVGVLKNYHQLSLQHTQIPTVFYLRPSSNFYSIKFRAGDVSETLDLIRRQYENHFSGNPFEYFFLDEYFDRQYRADQRFGQVFGLFSGLAIFIACLGLLALAADAALKRKQEIGIRKVLGASIPNLIALLSKDFLRLIAIAIVIALPVAGIVIERWLESYAYRIDLGWGLFVWPTMFVISIALVTVSTQAVKAALANPVEALRYE